MTIIPGRRYIPTAGSMVIRLLFAGMLPGVVVGWPAGVVVEVY